MAPRIPAGPLALVLAYSLITLVITIYGTILGFQVRGVPDPAQIQYFANVFTPWAAPLALAVSTFGAAVWAVRRVRSAPVVHGLAVGALAAGLGITLGLLSGTAALPLLSGAGAAVLAGWIGGVLGGHARVSRAA